MRPEFIVERNGRNFCLYAGLLDEAHQQGLKEIKTTLLQIPTDDNGQVAICQSEVTTEKGRFTGLGDASPQNVSRPMLTCLIRMAETRSKARALRDAVNVGVVALEELDSEGSGAEQDESPAGGSRNGGLPRSLAAGSAPIPPAAPAATGAPRDAMSQRVDQARTNPHQRSQAPAARNPAPVPTEDAMTPAQRRMLESMSRQAGETFDPNTNLTRSQASRRITELKARINETQRSA